MMRRVLAAILMLCALASCSRNPVEEHAFLMDTWCSITFYDRGDEELSDEAFAILEEIDARLDRFDSGSEVARINAQAGLSPVAVSEPTYKLIRRAKELSVMTGGAFNPLMGAVSDLWGFGSASPSVPGDDEIARLLEAVDIDNLVLDDGAMTVYLADDRISLDLGGIAKGHAADEVASFLKASGVERAVVNLGGNVWCIGQREEDRPWTVGLQDPSSQDGAYFTTVSVSDSSVVTSGSYQRFFIEDGVAYHHILDPATGRPADSDILSVSLVMDDSTMADALTTALFVMGSTDAATFCRQWGLSAVILTGNGEEIRIGL